MSRRILMNVADGDECRIAVVEDGRLFEYFVDRPSQLKHVGNIYKANVNNVEPGIQAAFVDMGLPRNGFLHVSDVLYAYQDNPKLTDLFPKEMRIKETITDEGILGSSAEQDVAEAESHSDDSETDAADESGPDASEAEFLEKLDEAPKGHKVTDSPLEVDEPQKDNAAANGRRKQTTRKTGAKPPAKKTSTRKTAVKKTIAKTKAETTGGDKPATKAVKKPVRKTTRKAAPKAKPATDANAETLGAEKPESTPAKPKAKRTRKPKLRGKQAEKSAEPTTSEPAGHRAIDGNTGGDNSAIPNPKRFHRSSAKVQNLLKRGQEVVVQVSKASQGGKGPGVSTFISLPGRYMVLTQNSDRGGVSRKIEDQRQRNALRKMLNKLPVPEGMGVIIRTAAIDRSYEDLLRDLNYLLRMWSVVAQRVEDTPAPALLYSDSDPAIRTVRDYFTADTAEILIDDKEVFERVKAFFEQLMPSFVDRVKLYEGEVPLFFAESLESEIEHIFDKKVPLKSGGYLFMEQTEALVSIDVNSGKFTSAGDAEKTAYLTNMEAIPEICRQLRLRDMGGIVCNDLIDMMQSKHRSDVERTLRKELRKDRARTKVARISPFGVIEMTRQRVRPSIKNYNYVTCPTCAGFGMVRSAETLCLSLIRRMKMALIEDRVAGLAVQVHPHVLGHLHSEFRGEIDSLEERYGKRIVFEYARDLVLGQSRFFYINDRGGRVFYDMDQRINTFLSETGKKSKSNVPVPVTPTGKASPNDTEQPSGAGKKKRRRRGGRKQREREQAKREREQRIEDQSGVAVNFGDALPDVQVTVVKDAPTKKSTSQKSDQPKDGQEKSPTDGNQGEGKKKRSSRRRRRGSGRGKAATAKTDSVSDNAPEQKAAAKPDGPKPAETKKAAPKRKTTRKAAVKKPAAKVE
ncbi:Rne/Rng family ribonuclease, partial [Planctomycetota bacterium]|nr:Rne/Rng family ribonuclease [Planctomycetota bacterium]